MENIEIAKRLEELADLLEIQGANRFRVRAYRNAVRTVAGETRSLAAMVKEGEDLTELAGIGKDLSGHIRELVETGDMEMLAEVTREVPRELATLTRLDGVGPRKAARLWKELDVTNVDALETAAEAGRVQELEGFGARSVEKILRAIQDYRSHQGRFLRADAVQYLRPLLEHLEGVAGIQRLEVAGSYRRGKETVGDIDLLAVVDGGRAAEVMERFTSFPGVTRVEMAGDTRGSVLLRSGLPVDLRLLGPESWGAALHYFTGSKEHNVEIRKRARKRGLRVSEYGVFREAPGEADGEADGGSGGSGDERKTDDRAGGPPADDGDPERGERVAGATEEEVFQAVDLPWIPPVLREDRGEIQAAEAGELPELVEPADIQGDLHMHTTWSDGSGSIREMAEACRERGYEYMAITDHSQAVTVANGLTPERLRKQWDEIDAARDEVEGIRILRGCEVDILRDGSLDLPDEILAELDIVLVAVHSHFELDTGTMTDRVTTALAHPLVDILVHPTGRLLNRREPYPIDMEAVLGAALEHQVAVELNTNPRRLDLHDRHLYRARELGVPVAVSTDAHRIPQLDYMGPGLDQARRGWLEADDVLNSRSFADLERWLRRSGR